MSWLLVSSFPNLETLEICRCERTNVLDFLHGTCYDLAPLAGLSKLKNLTLKGIGDSMTSIINFQHLPSSEPSQVSTKSKASALFVSEGLRPELLPLCS